jgi:hypothetical protein
MLNNIRVISRGRVAQLGEYLPGQQRVKACERIIGCTEDSETEFERYETRDEWPAA